MPLVNLYVGFESRHNMPARIRVFVDFIVDHFSIDDITQVSDPHPMIVRRAAATTRGAHSLHHSSDAVSAPLND